MWAVFLLPCHDSVLSGTLVGLFLVSGPFLYTGPGLSLASWEFLRAAEGPGRLRWSSAELIQLTGCSFSRETVNRRLEVTTEGLGSWRIPSPPPPYRHHINPYEKMFIIHVQIFASTWQNSATWWSHRAKNILFSPHVQVFIPHVQLSLSIFISYSFNIFFTYTLFYIFSFY